MTHHTFTTAFSYEDEPFDLSDIFIGREQQLDLFELYLDRWKKLMFSASLDDTFVTTPPSPNNKVQGLVALLYGRGGFGKSTLLRRYRDIALQNSRNLTLSKIVDWEFAVEGKRGLFNPPSGQEIDATEYFKVLCGQLAIALDKKPQAFEEYQAAVRDVEKARKEASGILDVMQKDDRFGWLRDLTVEAVMTAVRTYVPGSKVVLENEKVKVAANAVGKVTEEQISQVLTKLHNKLGNKIGDYLDPALRLGLALGKDLHELARNFPLLIFFDTYEEVDEGDRFLRMVMGAAGGRVGWILAGRDNLWAGPDQIERNIALEYGYKEIVLSDRGLPVDFNIGGIGAFTITDIKEYFDLLCKKAPYHPPLPKVTAEGAKRILDVTKGVPLAVKIAAGLYMETADLGTLTEEVEGKREIVDKMVRRYLLHARDNQSERAKLYGLAMLRRADEPTAVAAALGLTPEQARISYTRELAHLHRHYSFIFTEKEEPSLHQEVRYFLRLWLLERCKAPEIVAINEALKEAHQTELKKLESQRKYRTLNERLQDDEWIGTYLDLIEQQFWLDPIDGMHYYLPFMLAADIYRRSEKFWTKSMEVPRRYDNVELIEVGKFFEMSVMQPYHDLLRWATQNLTTSEFSWLEKRYGLEHLEQLKSQGFLAFPQPLPGFQEELEALLWVRLGDSHGIGSSEAWELYERAFARLGNNENLGLGWRIAELNYLKGESLYQQQKIDECIPFFERAIELGGYSSSDYLLAQVYLKRGSACAYSSPIAAIGDFDRAIAIYPRGHEAYLDRGWAYYKLKDYQHAFADFDRAIELDPKNGLVYSDRGEAYYKLKDYQHAFADFDRAIELYPKNLTVYIKRGKAYYELKDYQRAFADFDHAIDLDSKDAYSYSTRGRAYCDLNEYRRAFADFDHAIELDSKNAYFYSTRGLAYCELKDYQRAFADFDHAIELDPTDAYFYYCRGQAYCDLREYRRAITEFDRAIELDPTNATHHAMRGIIYKRLKEHQHATNDFNQALRLDPDEISTVWIVEWSQWGHERVGTEVAERLEVLAALDHEHYDAYVCRGVALGIKGRIKAGLIELEKAIQLEPEAPDTYFWKGMLSAYYYQGRYQMAANMIEQSLERKLPPLLLTPLYWLEKDRPDFFEKYVRPLLEKYDVR